MEAVFVTERIILLSAHEDIPDGSYRPAIKQISLQLQTDYKDHYLIMNVSDPRADLIRLNKNVMDFGWPAALAPPLERLCTMCKQVDVWMNAEQQKNVLVIHCKGGLGRAAVAVASYMHYTSICATSSQALDRYAMKRFFDDELKRHILPSQRRSMSESEGRRILSVQLRPALQLRGDILIKCQHQRKMRPVANSRDVIFRCQLHTCAVSGSAPGPLLLNKCDLDEANTDIRFPEDCRVELLFSLSQDNPQFPLPSEGRVGSNLSDNNHNQIRGNFPDLILHGNDERDDSYSSLIAAGVNREEAGLSEWNYGEDRVGGGVDTVDSGRRKDIGDNSEKDFEDQPLYATIHKKPGSTKNIARYQPPSANLPHIRDISSRINHKSPESDRGLGGSKENPLSVSVDSGISTSAAAPKSTTPAHSYIGTAGTIYGMDRKGGTVSPGGTMKSVKFQDGINGMVNGNGMDGLDNQENRRPPLQTSAGKLRNGLQVVDLDAVQPDMEELDRVFESLQAETEDLDRHLSNSGSILKKKPQPAKTASSGASVVTRSVSQKQTSRPPLMVSNSVDSAEPPRSYQRENSLNAQPPQPPTSPTSDGLITGYVPQDRKGFGKKYGAFTFGLPTGKPELKPVTSPTPARRVPEEDLDIYGRTKLRHVSESGSASDRERERRRAEEKLYSSAAPTPSRSRGTTPASRDGPDEDREGIYGKITARSSSVNPSGPKGSNGGSGSGAPYSVQSRSLDRDRGRSRSPQGNRPRTPTEDERLMRLLDVEAGEFLISDDEKSVKSKLKEIAREGQVGSNELEREEYTPRKPERAVPPQFIRNHGSPDVTMESSLLHTETMESPVPDRRKKKKITTTTDTHMQSFVPDADRHIERGPPGRHDAPAWLQLQHEKLMSRRFGPDYARREDRHSELLEELKRSQERMIEQVPNRDDAENKLPLSSIILREAKTPPLERRNQINRDSNGYAVVKGKTISTVSSQPVRSSAQRQTYSAPTVSQVHSRHYSDLSQERSKAVGGENRSLRNVSAIDMIRNAEAGQTHHGQHGPTMDPDHDSIVDEIDFGDEPLYKTITSANSHVSRSREIEQKGREPSGRAEEVNGYHHTTSNPASPDLLRRAAPSPKSILKNPSLQRRYKSASQDRNGTSDNAGGYESDQNHRSRERAATPNFPVSSSLERQNEGGSIRRGRDREQGRRERSQSSSLQRAGYSIYGTRERAGTSSGRSTPTGYFGLSGSRRSSLNAIDNSNMNDDANEFVIHHHPIFVKDLSKFWYKPSITREEAIEILRDKPAGTFLIRDSHSYPGAFGLAVKVDANQVPGGAGPGRGSGDELVRHFLVEPTPNGVHLKGCQNEPIFGSLPALVYQHSITPLALPCKLVLPDKDLTLGHQPLYSEDNIQRLMEQGAACNVFYLVTVDTESLTGPQAIRRAMDVVLHGGGVSVGAMPPVVHFKVNAQGILLTDSKRKIFFRRHYLMNNVTYCGLDPDDRRYTSNEKNALSSARCFGFVSRKPFNTAVTPRIGSQNECHLFAELEPEQPAAAVVSFVNKVMMTSTVHPTSIANLPYSASSGLPPPAHGTLSSSVSQPMSYQSSTLDSADGFSNNRR